jgi:predicted DNA-binding protein
MEIEFAPEVQAKLDRLATETGRPPAEFVQDALSGYFEGLDELRSTLDSRYDEIESGSVDLVSGEEVFARLREKSRLRRAALEPQGL